MTAIKWWLRVVGSLYLLEGGGLTAAALADPAAFAAIWASTDATSLDAVAVRGTLMAGLPGVLTWLLLGVMMWLYSRTPAKSVPLVIFVACWELFVWAPVDVVGVFNGFEVGRAATLLAIHALIGVSGLLLLRRPRVHKD
jgi:hypothetical protein